MLLFVAVVVVGFITGEINHGEKAHSVPLLLIEQQHGLRTQKIQKISNDDDSQNQQQQQQGQQQGQQQQEQQQQQQQQQQQGQQQGQQQQQQQQQGQGHEDEEVSQLKQQALLINQKFQKAERAGKVGDKLPADLVGNAEATSETFWNDVGQLTEDDVKDATPEDEKEVGHLVTEVSQMDDDMVTEDNEKKVPLEYSKLSEELGELKGEGDI